jgi:hypothetical protein
LEVGERQHFVPKFYLRQFTDPATPADREPYVWVVDLASRTIRRKAPGSIAAETNLYEWDSPPAGAQRVEDLYENFESRSAPLLARLQGGYDLNVKERWTLSTYMALQLTRTPRFREAVRCSAEPLSRRLAERAFTTAAPLVRLREQAGLSVKEALRKYQPRIDFSRDQQIAIALKAALENFGAFIFSNPWNIMRAPADAPFLTTDEPVSLLTPDAQPRSITFSPDERNPELQIAFVVSLRIALLVHQLDDKSRLIELTSRQVGTCNHGMLRAAHRWAYCNSQTQAEWARDRDVTVPPTERIPIYVEVEP